jgi:beta-lactamase regulating signal transducer with metallopeptidase domain
MPPNIPGKANHDAAAGIINSLWKGLFKAGGTAALTMLVLVIIRGKLFRKTTARLGIAAGVLMMVSSSA